ncbi:SusC/RagA family TonB-linked outer membrane protein [Flavivirga eckloniae]|uniref:SusC/RagA family TonB-linked outer membrane protein n=2 Tax=Flavivirga eckloniae TaxID=1803846 RepID=A0A2K9PWY0_9FLAO|nr:SusC/RagA family TonB-linked outer membrane protein [Flavivirga eckloniae]
MAFTQQISGTITDGATNLPLAGANIIIKGTNIGATSDFDGRYSINVSSFPVTLEFSSLGFETLEEVVRQAGTVNVTLQESAESLEEVVITGLASSIKRTNAANAVASISADDLAGRTPPQTLDGAMAGKFVGAQITQASGAPGGGISVKLRGVTSINANGQPLYIVDGVYVNNNSVFAGGLNEVSGAAGGGATTNDSQDNASNRIADINPDDIENIEILKGASASAIYGARAAAGVVIITTKRGKQGKTKIKFSQALGWNEAVNLLGTRKWNAELAENGDPITGIGGRAGAGALFTAAQTAGRLVDWEKEIYGEKGFITNTNLSASGGSEKTSFFASFTSNEEEGIVKRTGAGRKSFRLNVDHKITENIKIDLSGNYVTSSADRGFFNNENNGTTIGFATLFSRPWDDFFPVNGIYPDNQNGGSNPIHTRDVMTNNEDVSRIIAGAGLDVNLFSNDKQSLKLFINAGVDTYTLKTTVFFPRDLQFMNPNTGVLPLDGLTSDGTTKNTDANYSAFLVHNYLNNNEISFKTQVGLTNNQFLQNTVRVTSNGLIGSESNVDQSTNVAVSQTRLEQEDFGFFIQEEINYQDKIIGTLGIRGDKSSNNGDANELFYYPKASVAVKLHKLFTLPEDMELKLRTAYGEAGNFAPNGALFTRYLNTLITRPGDGKPFAGIITSNTLGDPTIKPERQKELEFGFDMGLFNKRLFLEFTYYKKDVEDLILSADNQASSGFSFRWANAGELENRGVEIALNGSVFDKGDFTWDTGVIFFKNTSEITKLNVNPFNTQGFRTSLGTFRIEEGKSATQIAGNDSDGNVATFGDSEPDFQMSFNNNFKYKDFTLSFFWHWKKGGENVNLTRLLTDDSGTSHDWDDLTLDPEGKTPNGFYRLSSLEAGTNAYIEDASYLKLREVGLYYNVPKGALNKWFGDNVSDVKLGFSGRNLINVFDYDSYDPEVSNFGSAAAGIGIEVAPFPSSKRYMFHLSVGL